MVKWVQILGDNFQDKQNKFTSLHPALKMILCERIPRASIMFWQRFRLRRGTPLDLQQSPFCTQHICMPDASSEGAREVN